SSASNSTTFRLHMVDRPLHHAESALKSSALLARLHNPLYSRLFRILTPLAPPGWAVPGCGHAYPAIETSSNIVLSGTLLNMICAGRTCTVLQDPEWTRVYEKGINAGKVSPTFMLFS